MSYKKLLEKKDITMLQAGFDVDLDNLNPLLYTWQKYIVRWAVKKGKAALFEDCGLGKTIQQLEWAQQIINHEGGKVIIFSPLAVAEQTKREGVKFGYDVNICLSLIHI